MCPRTFPLVLVLLWEVVHPHSRSRTEWKNTHTQSSYYSSSASLIIWDMWGMKLVHSVLIVFCVLRIYLPVIHSHFPGTASIGLIIRCWFFLCFLVIGRQRMRWWSSSWETNHSWFVPNKRSHRKREVIHKKNSFLTSCVTMECGRFAKFYANSLASSLIFPQQHCNGSVHTYSI